MCAFIYTNIWSIHIYQYINMYISEYLYIDIYIYTNNIICNIHKVRVLNISGRVYIYIYIYIYIYTYV